MVNILPRLIGLAEYGFAYSQWYDDACDFIVMECDHHGWDHDDFINVLAVTSPRISVKRNWDVTVALLSGANINKLGLIQATRVAYQHYRNTGEIRGPKTSAFARALHGDTTALVLDSWMARALNVPHSKVTNVSTMEWAKGLMEQVADHHSLSVRDAQAAVWAGIAKLEGVTPGTLETAVLRSSQMSWEF